MDLRPLLDAHYASIWRLLRRFGVEESALDDAAQEVFWVAARRLGDIRPGSEHSFLYGIAIRIAARARRKQQQDLQMAGTDDLDTIRDAGPNPEHVLDEQRARAFLDRVLDQMPSDLREVFVLFELEEIEIPAIAVLLAIPIGTVGSRLRRAREEFSAITKRTRAKMTFRGAEP